MDLLAACRAFVAVADRGNVTAGAQAIGVQQSVASRRISALEQRVGEALFDRSGRRLVPTPAGRDLVPAARRLIELADVFDLDAADLRTQARSCAVPAASSTDDLARLDAAARNAGHPLDLRAADPPARAELVRTGAVRLALLAVPASEADWSAELGIGALDGPARPFRLGSVRPTRTVARRRRVQLQPEDCVPHVGDALGRAASSVGLSLAQVVGNSLVGALSAALRDDDLLVCTKAQAISYGLTWRRFADGERMTRGHRLCGSSTAEVDRARAALGPAIARCLGARQRSSS